MGKPAPEAPTPVDPNVVSAAQTTSNLATAQAQSQLNNVNVNSPYGSVAYSQPGGADTPYTQTTTLSPAEQAIFNQGTAAQGKALGIATGQLNNVQNALNTPVNAPTLQTGVSNGPIASGYASGGPIQSGYDAGGPIQGQIGNQNVNQSVSDAEMANFAGQMQLLQPQMDQASEHQNAALVAQGLNPNDAAFQNSQTLFNNGQAVQLGQAASNAVAAGNAEQNTLFGQQAQQGEFANTAQAQANTENQQAGTFANAAQAQGNTQAASAAGFANTAQGQANSEAMANADLNNTAKQQQFTDQTYAQQLPINEFDALMSSGQVQAPTSTPAQTAVAPTDVTGAYALSAQQQQAAYQSQMQQYQSGLGGLFNLGSAAMGMFSL